MEGGTVLATVQADAQGRGSISLGLSDGAHEIQARTGDVAGNTSSAALSFTIDREPPTVTLSLTDDTGVSSSDRITSRPSLTASTDPFASLTLVEDGQIVGVAVSDASGQAHFSPPAADGQHAFTVYATDPAGNTGSDSLTLTVDSEAPTVLSVTSSDSSPSNADTIHFTVTFSEPVNGFDASQFDLATTGTLTGVAVSDVEAVPGSDGAQYVVTVDTGTGDGTISAALPGEAVTDLAGNALSVMSMTSYSVGAQPHAVAAADVDGDGYADIVTASANGVTVLYGTATGTYSDSSSNDSVTDLVAVAAADLDGDGRADLVVVDSSGTVSALHSQSDRLFAVWPHMHQTATHAREVQVADLNGDGRPDIVTTNPLDGTVSVLLGNGDGTFQDALDYAAGSGPQGIAIGDVNGDGYADIVVANPSDHSISILLGSGDGTFAPPVELSGGDRSRPVDVAIADLNRDGLPDIVVADAGLNEVSVYLGSGDGGFAPAIESAAGDTPIAVAAADVDGDGYEDLVVVDSGSNSVSVLHGSGDGRVQLTNHFETGDIPTQDQFVDVIDSKLRKGYVAVIDQGSDSVSVLHSLYASVPTFTVDRTPPDVTISLSHDTGASSSDGVTSDADAHRHGRPRCRRDPHGEWRRRRHHRGRRQGPLEHQHRPVRRHARDYGQRDRRRRQYRQPRRPSRWTVDTTAPTVAMVLSNDSGSSSSDRITHDSSVTVSTDPFTSLTLLEDGQIVAVAVADENGQGHFTVQAAEGQHTFTVHATDAAGNTGSDSLDFTVDTSPPDLTLELAHDTGKSSSDGLTNDQTLRWATDPYVETTFMEGGAVLATTQADAQGRGSISLGLSDGAHTIVVQTTDAAGNTASDQLSFTLDTQAPPPPSSLFLSDTSGTFLAMPALIDGYVNAAHDTTSLPLTGTAPQGVVIVIDDGIQLLGTTVAGADGSWSFALGKVGDGQHSLSATATDSAGNSSVASPPLDFTVDTSPPDVTMALAHDTGVSSSDRLTSDPTLSGTGDPNAGVTLTENGAVVGTTVADAQGRWSTSTGLADGTHTITASETDLAGNTGSASLSFTVDTSPPVVTVALSGDLSVSPRRAAPPMTSRSRARAIPTSR